MKNLKSLAVALTLMGFAAATSAHDVGNWSSSAGEVWKNTPVKTLCHPLGFIALQGTNAVPLGVFHLGEAFGTFNLLNRFLNVIFPKTQLTLFF